MPAVRITGTEKKTAPSLKGGTAAEDVWYALSTERPAGSEGEGAVTASRRYDDISKARDAMIATPAYKSLVKQLDFPKATWTKAGALEDATVELRKTALGLWLNGCMELMPSAVPLQELLGLVKEGGPVAVLSKEEKAKKDAKAKVVRSALKFETENEGILYDIEVGNPEKSDGWDGKQKVRYLVSIVTDAPAFVKASSATPDGSGCVTVSSRRTYSEFELLRNQLHAMYPLCDPLAPMPKKIPTPLVNQKEIKNRTMAFDLLMKEVGELGGIRQLPQVLAFFSLTEGGSAAGGGGDDSEIQNATDPRWGMPGFLSPLQTERLAVFKAKHPGIDAEALLRFLRVREFDVKRATKLIKENIAWKEENKPGELGPSFGTKIVNEKDDYERSLRLGDMCETGEFVLLPGKDDTGRPVICIFVAEHDEWLDDYTKTTDMCVKALIYLIEKVTQDSEFFTLVFHMENWDPSEDATIDRTKLEYKLPVDVAWWKGIVTALQVGYPGQMGMAYVVGAPPFFSKTWKATINPLLEYYTQRRFEFVESAELLKRAISEENLPTELGGKAELTDAVPGEVKWKRESSKSTRLATKKAEREAKEAEEKAAEEAALAERIEQIRELKKQAEALDDASDADQQLKLYNEALKVEPRLKLVHDEGAALHVELKAGKDGAKKVIADAAAAAKASADAEAATAKAEAKAAADAAAAEKAKEAKAAADAAAAAASGDLSTDADDGETAVV